MKHSALLLLLLVALTAHAQEEQPPYTSADARWQGFEKRKALAERSLVKGIEFRSIGPTVFSGRVADIDVREEDPSHFYVGYASGGLWKTENNGITFTPLFDREAIMTIGDIAVDWARNTIWVGTGEVNASRSSYAGAGVYKSEDGGETWSYAGLPETHHIGRIVLHPENPDIAWVAALGHLYSANRERGVFKTVDGGETWQHTLFLDENTGVVDLLPDPRDPEILYAAAWERTRRAWNFVEAGPGSAIYKSSDGGDTWTRLTGENSGFPHNQGAGRIGLAAVTTEAGNTLLYAAIDNYNRRDKEEEEPEEGLTKEDLRDMPPATFLELDSSDLADYLADNEFPEKYPVDTVLQMVEDGRIAPNDLVSYVEDANALLFDTPVVGLEVYRSEDGGKRWTRTHDGFLDAVYNSYGYYFGQIRVSPHDPDKLYVMGVPILRSDDGGATWTSINGDNVHADHHALWINPNRPGHLILGNDGGINLSYDDGEHWIKCNSPALGQFYAVAVDMAEPYRVYGGLQDNGVWMGPSDYETGTEWHGSGQYPYREILGGDGMQVAVDTRDNNTVYTGFQFGNYYRINTATGERTYITPKHDLGERPLRWNWQTPIHLSRHNQDILYMGSHRVHRSLDQGESFTPISDDLTQGGKKGDVPYGTLTTLHESPLRFGLLYAGSDDGLIHRSRDGGATWELISDETMPADMWVTRVEASAHREGRVYAALNGYRWDDFSAYLYVSEDHGDTWTPLGPNLPAEPVNEVHEDPENERILYVGTDHGLYLSLDRGRTFMLMDHGLPAVPVHDVVVHPREGELLVGTHGRSLYLANVRELQQLRPEVLERDLFAFDIEPVRHRSRWGNARADWAEPLEPEILLPVYTRTAGPIEVRVATAEDLTIQSLTYDSPGGLQYIPYDLTVAEDKVEGFREALAERQNEEDDPPSLEEGDNGKYYLVPGTYTVTCRSGSGETTVPLEVE